MSYQKGKPVENFNPIFHPDFSTIQTDFAQRVRIEFISKIVIFYLFVAGIQGPTIRAEVNDRVVIHFKNFASYPLSISPIGIPYWKQSEGEPPPL